MVDTFAALKRSRETSLERLTKEVSKFATKTTNQADDRFWQPEVDKSGNGYAVIRLLPAPVGEDVPWVRIWNHGFQGPGGWYIENSLTTIGQDDPVSEYNSKLWNSGSEKDKELARKQKRRLVYICNIMVIKDPARPQNEGKVFLYKFGKKVFDKINALMNPEFEDETPVNPFDLWEGANFKLKIRSVEGYRNYDKSEFDKPSAVAETDEDIERIWKSEYSLAEFLDPSNFKSYSELKTRLDRALGLLPTTKTVVSEEVEEEEDFRPSSAPRVGKTQKAEPSDDDDLDFFRKLAEDDE